jgi:hypothetical protein
VGEWVSGYARVGGLACVDMCVCMVVVVYVCVCVGGSSTFVGNTSNIV